MPTSPERHSGATTETDLMQYTVQSGGATAESESGKYAGKNPFTVMEAGEKLPSKGIMFSFKFSGHEGVGHVFVYDTLKVTEEGKDNGLHLSVQGCDLYFAIENPKAFDHSREPYDRVTGASYMPYGIEEFDPILTAKPALVQKTAHDAELLGYVVRNEHDSDFSRVFEAGKLDELQNVIAGVLQEKIGLSQTDAERVASEVINRLPKQEKSQEK